MVELSVKRMNKFEREGTARAFCDVAIGEAFLIKGVKVIAGKLEVDLLRRFLLRGVREVSGSGGVAGVRPRIPLQLH